MAASSSSTSSSGSSALAPTNTIVPPLGSTSSSEIPAELEGDLAVVVPALAAEPDVVVLEEHGGISHIKGASEALVPLAFDAPPDHTAEETAMQARLNEVLPGMCVDVSTPRDGHCLFHRRPLP